uniref:Uncharacterized protein n=1 Tax=Arundo donax TaxID=35708 RepID=A0A0A9FT18_ARUDO
MRWSRRGEEELERAVVG